MIPFRNNVKNISLFKHGNQNELLMGLNENGSGTILNLDSEQIAFRFYERKSTRIVEQIWVNSKTLIQLIDEPVPHLQKYELINSDIIKTDETYLRNLEKVSCL